MEAFPSPGMFPAWIRGLSALWCLFGQASTARGAPGHQFPPCPAETSLPTHTTLSLLSGKRRLSTSMPKQRISLAVLELGALALLPADPSSAHQAGTAPEPDPRGRFWQLGVNNWNSVTQSHEDGSCHLFLAFSV